MFDFLFKKSKPKKVYSEGAKKYLARTAKIKVDNGKTAKSVDFYKKDYLKKRKKRATKNLGFKI